MMVSTEWLRRKLEMLEQRLLNSTSSVVEFTTLSRTSGDGTKDFANFAGNPADRQRPVRRVSPWGIVGRPPAGTLTALVKAAAGVFNGMTVGIVTDRHGPQNLAEGDVCLYNTAIGLKIYLKASDGSITITDGAGQTFTLDGFSTATVNAILATTINATQVNLGSAAADANIKGTTYRAAETILLASLQALNVALKTYATAIQGLADPMNTATPPLTAASDALTAAMSAFNGGSAGYLSLKVKTE